MINIDKFLEKISNWAKNEEDILAIGLAGSYARNEAKEDSDVDLIIIVKDPEKYVLNNSWIGLFGEVIEIKDEVWSQLKTKRVFYKDGLEVEFNFDKKTWANPDDAGTRRVVDGMKVLVDKEGILKRLI